MPVNGTVAAAREARKTLSLPARTRPREDLAAGYDWTRLALVGACLDFWLGMLWISERLG
jgi:hypothetical protein